MIVCPAGGRYLHICLDNQWRPHHWMSPQTVGELDYRPVCGGMTDLDAPPGLRLLAPSDIDRLTCPACKKAFRAQRAIKRKGLR